MAYGVNAPWGFKPSVHLSGTPIVSSDQNEYKLASGTVGSIFIGDPVTLTANGVIVRATAGATNTVLGVFAGVKYYDAQNNFVQSPYWPTGTATFGGIPALAYVWDAADILYDVQVDNAIAGGATAVNIGENANVVYNTAGSTISGISGATINSIAPADATKQFKIVRFVPSPNNAPGITNNNVLVLINTYFWAPNTAGI